VPGDARPVRGSFDRRGPIQAVGPGDCSPLSCRANLRGRVSRSRARASAVAFARGASGDKRARFCYRRDHRFNLTSWQMTEQQSPNERPAGVHERMSWPMIALRYLLPGAVVLGGLIVMALGSEAELEGGAGIVSAGLAIYAMNWLYRASVDGDRVRDEEEAARTFFGEHGRWPDEKPPSSPASSPHSPQPSERSAPLRSASDPVSGASAQRPFHGHATGSPRARARGSTGSRGTRRPS